ncbi:hypothetical protein TNCV_3356251 [Trichonephila clavipes]|nr:hypothetical protein TNCV_3356251 [Trichonephila clavipes]
MGFFVFLRHTQDGDKGGSLDFVKRIRDDVIQWCSISVYDRQQKRERIRRNNVGYSFPEAEKSISLCENMGNPYIELRGDNPRPFKWSKTVEFDKFNLNPILRVVIRRLASTNAFITSLSASTGLPERGASSTSN